MKTKSALIGSDGVVALNSIAAIDTKVPLIVDPRNAEGDDSVRLSHPFENLRVAIFRMLQYVGHYGLSRLLHRLMEFGLPFVPLDETLHERVNFGLDCFTLHT